MLEINRGRINLLLSSAAFTTSSAGSVLLHIVLAVTVYAKTGSGLMTSVFVSLQWLPALLVVLYRSDWDHGMNPRKRWFVLELVSATLTLPVLLFIASDNYLAVAVVLLVRGLVDHVNRINKTVAARVLFPKAKATHYASFLQSSYHVGIALAAVLGILLAKSIDIRLVAALDALTFIVAAGLIGLTRCVEEVEEGAKPPRRSLAARITEYREALQGDRRLFICALLPPLTSTFFQGTYSALQPIFPIQRLGLDSAAVSVSYVIVSAAVVVGSSAFSFFCKKHRLFEQPFARTQLLAVVLSIAAATLYIGTVWSAHAFVSAALFALMVVVFEFTWMMGYGGIVAFAPKGQLGSVFGISFAIGCFCASVLATLVGALVDIFGGAYTTLIGLLMMAYLSILVPAVLSYKSARANVAANSAALEPSK
jgi:predicted MFS family arabinose efflux permease